MKRITGLCLILLLAITTVLCVTACGPNPNGGKDDTPGKIVSYEISVDTGKVSVDTGAISVCVYSLDGTLVGEKKLSQSKTLFELNADNYVATLSGLSGEVSYSSVLLTKTTKKATIVVEKAKLDESLDEYTFAFTVIVLAGNVKLDDLEVQLCDDTLCKSMWFDNGNAADIYVGAGDYIVKVYVYSGNGQNQLYQQDYTVTLERRFCILVLKNKQVL